MKPRKSKVLATRVEYIDPADCDSQIGYKIIDRRRRLQGDVGLTDCNRKITWYFDDTPESLLKINRALAILTEFRDKFIVARRRRGKSRLTNVV